MTRFAAFACLVCAAFAWVPPFVDRAGLAALGFAFVALNVGRVRGGARPALFAPRARPELEPMPDVEPSIVELRDRLAAYSSAGSRDSSSPLRENTGV